MIEEVKVSNRGVADEVLNRRLFCQGAFITVAGLFASISGLTCDNKSKEIDKIRNPNVGNDKTGEKIADGMYQNTYLIKDEYCNSDNKAFNHLTSFKPEDFFKRFSQSEESNQKLTTTLFDKYGKPEKFIKTILKDLTGKEKDVKIEYDKNLDERIGAKYDQLTNTIYIRPFDISEQNKLYDYNFISRLLSLAHEMGHAINTLAIQNIKELDKEVENRISSKTEDDIVDSNDLKLTKDELLRYTAITSYDEAIASLFTISVANYLLERHPEFTTEIKKTLAENDNSDCFYFKAYKEGEQAEKNYLTCYSKYINNANYNGALIAYALVNELGNAEKAFNALTLNDVISPNLYKKMMAQYEIADRLNCNVVSVFRDQINKIPANEKKSVIILLQKYGYVLEYMGYKREEMQFLLEDSAKKFGISVVENK